MEGSAKSADYEYWGNVHDQLVKDITPIIEEIVKDDAKYKVLDWSEVDTCQKGKSFEITYTSDWAAPPDAAPIVSLCSKGIDIRMGWMVFKNMHRFWFSFHQSVFHKVVRESRMSHYVFCKFDIDECVPGSIRLECRIKTDKTKWTREEYDAEEARIFMAQFT